MQKMDDMRGPTPGQILFEEYCKKLGPIRLLRPRRSSLASKKERLLPWTETPEWVRAIWEKRASKYG